MRREISEKIPAVSPAGPIGDVMYDALQHDGYKETINAMIVAYTDTVDFEERVMKYTGKAYDNRIRNSGRFWFSTILASVIVSGASAGIALLLTYKP